MTADLVSYRTNIQSRAECKKNSAKEACFFHKLYRTTRRISPSPTCFMFILHIYNGMNVSTVKGPNKHLYIYWITGLRYDISKESVTIQLSSRKMFEFPFFPCTLTSSFGMAKSSAALTAVSVGTGAAAASSAVGLRMSSWDWSRRSSCCVRSVRLTWRLGSSRLAFRRCAGLKGQCHEIFCFRFFSRIIFPQVPETIFRVISIFFKNSQDIFAKNLEALFL
jgi:hypothetical protein